MEFVEVETKEDIMAAGQLVRTIAPDVLCGPALHSFLCDIEHKIRLAMENDTEYYLVCRQGPVGYAALVNEGDCLAVKQIGFAPGWRRKGLLKRTLAFLAETYDPPLMRIDGWGKEQPALEALGFHKREDVNFYVYEKIFYV